jgi:TorA maturation chaperone TorD
MNNPADIPSLELFRAAVALDLGTLAVLHNAELDDATLGQLKLAGFPEGIGLRLTGDAGREAMAFLSQAMDELSSPLSCDDLNDLAADYAAIYLTYGLHASPCESVWLDQENLGMQAPMFQVREFYRHFDLAAANWRMRPDDHLVIELHFLSCLMGDEHPQALPEAARFLDEHLLRWLPRFADRVSARCATPFYAGTARLTAAYCDELRDILAGLLGEARPTAEEVEARMQPRAASQAVPMTYVPGVAPSW